MDNDKASGSVANDVSTIREKLRELIRYASVSRLKVHTDCEEVEVCEMGPSFRPGRILANNMVFILVSGDALRVTFKAHFNMETGKSLAFRVFGGNSPEDISRKQAIDYFKEFGNLVAGSVVTLFEQMGIDLGISLPLCTRGFYEVFSDYTEKENPVITYSDFWGLKVNDNTVYCSALIEILDRKALGPLVDFEIVEDAAGDDEEMDFL